MQIHRRKEELDELRVAAARSGRSIAALVRDAIRKLVLKPRARLQSGMASRSVRPSTTIAFTTSPDAARGGGFRRQWAWIALALAIPCTNRDSQPSFA